MVSQMPRQEQCFKEKAVNNARSWSKVQKDKDLDVSLGISKTARGIVERLRLVVGREARLQWAEELVA